MARMIRRYEADDSLRYLKIAKRQYGDDPAPTTPSTSNTIKTITNPTSTSVISQNTQSRPRPQFPAVTSSATEPSPNPPVPPSPNPSPVILTPYTSALRSPEVATVGSVSQPTNLQDTTLGLQSTVRGHSSYFTTTTNSPYLGSIDPTTALTEPPTTIGDEVPTGISAHRGNSTNIKVIVPAVVVPLAIILLIGLCFLLRRRQQRGETIPVTPYTQFPELGTIRNRQTVSKRLLLGMEVSDRRAEVTPNLNELETRAAHQPQLRQLSNLRNQIHSSAAAAAPNLNSIPEVAPGAEIAGTTPSPSSTTSLVPLTSRVQATPPLASRIAMFFRGRKGREGSSMEEMDNNLATLRWEVERLRAALTGRDQRDLSEAHVDLVDAEGPPEYVSLDGTLLRNLRSTDEV